MFQNLNFFGKTVEAYETINNLAIVLMLLHMLLHVKDKKEILSKFSRRMVVQHKDEQNILSSELFYSVAETIILCAVWMAVGKVCNSTWAKLITHSYANYFGVVLLAGPLFFVVCILLKVPAFEQMDLFTPSFIVNLAVGKIACFCCGCCYGKEMENSFYYSQSRERFEFPIQLLEFVVAIAIFVVIVIFLKKKRTPGFAFPIYVFLYSFTRFFTEFFRDDFKPLLGALTTYHFQCIAGVVLGIAEILFLQIYFKKRKAVCDKTEQLL